MATFALAEKAILLNPVDDVMISKVAIPAGTIIEDNGSRVEVHQDVRPGHKIARHPAPVGAPVRRYGQIIGFATQDITVGDHVHVHNLAVGELRQTYEVGVDARPVAFYPPEQMRYFDGFKRADGRVGTRNYVAVISTVNCSASVSQFVREKFRDIQKDYPNVDGVLAITHKSGCGQVLGSEDYWALQRVLAGYARHPNVAGYLVIGLGCEVNQAAVMVDKQKLTVTGTPDKPAVITIQESGGVRKTVDAAVRAIAGILPRANEARRTRQPISELILATNCGGSDGNSGITANPALGWAVDELVRHGGTGVLAETTEIYGAEQLLVRRAINEGVAKKLLDRFDWWLEHLRARGGVMDNNPAPGNKAGGLTTVYEKSLGGVTKGGTTPLMDVFLYGEPITTRGFVFMDTPGHDPVSITGLVAGGANIICFTTGRGSVFGCKPVPSIKLATNSIMYRHMEDDMDINCGVILEGTPLEHVGRQIFEEVIAVSSGKKSKSEQSGVGEEEFAPWMIGPVL
jgi:altronate hydrolase